MKKILVGFLFFFFCAVCLQAEPIRLATTTSTENSGLLQVLIPHFKKQTGYEVHVLSVGTGQALRMGKDGNVDVVLVHAQSRKAFCGSWIWSKSTKCDGK